VSEASTAIVTSQGKTSESPTWAVLLWVVAFLVAGLYLFTSALRARLLIPIALLWPLCGGVELFHGLATRRPGWRWRAAAGLVGVVSLMGLVLWGNAVQIRLLSRCTASGGYRHR
jgi:uncharacterized membrane protein HdeD (DUF308 family)